MKTSDYMRLPYHITLVRDEDAAGDAAWVASVNELPGCISQGDTPEEAAAMIREAMEAWIEVSLEHGDPIPEPLPLRAVGSQGGAWH
ncbi:MAG: type II toxin-antitoxin system HicB family antitoxin [Dehalococcoidia bacterium]